MTTPTRPPSHRRWRLDRLPSWQRRLIGALGATTAILLTLIAGQAIIRTEPDYNETLAPFFFEGEPNEPVTASNLRVTLLGVRGAAKAGPEDGFFVDTDGVWVVVRLRFEALTKATGVGQIALADSAGRTFRATGRFTQPLAGGLLRLQPGIPVEGEVAFEVPRDGTGLRFQAGALGMDLTNGGQMSAYTDIRVPMSADDVNRWLNDPAPAAIGEPKVGG